MSKAFFTLAAMAFLSAGAAASTSVTGSSDGGYVTDVSASAGVLQVAGRSSEAEPSAVNARAERGTYYWLHPKLGHVKVDRRTHAMVVSPSASDRAVGK